MNERTPDAFDLVMSGDIIARLEREIERLTLEVATHKARADAAEKERDAAHSARREALRSRESS